MSKSQQRIILGLAIVAFFILCVFGLGLYALLADDSSVVPTTTPIVAALPTSTRTLTCTELRFGGRLSPDDVDILLDEGEVLDDVWEIAVRFDCPRVSPDQISFKWYYNGKDHCTYTYISDDCDRSSLIDWENSPGKFLITLYSKDLADNLAPGKYELVVFVDERRVRSNTVTVAP